MRTSVVPVVVVEREKERERERERERQRERERERERERAPLRYQMKIPAWGLDRPGNDEVCSSREVSNVAHMRECLIICLIIWLRKQ